MKVFRFHSALFSSACFFYQPIPVPRPLRSTASLRSNDLKSPALFAAQRTKTPKTSVPPFFFSIPHHCSFFFFFFLHFFVLAFLFQLSTALLRAGVEAVAEILFFLATPHTNPPQSFISKKKKKTSPYFFSYARFFVVLFPFCALAGFENGGEPASLVPVGWPRHAVLISFPKEKKNVCCESRRVRGVVVLLSSFLLPGASFWGGGCAKPGLLRARERERERETW